MDRVKRVKLILWSILGLAASVGITRFYFGLGAVTNLTDRIPWGLWIGFDVVSGVALASGGFVITATVYIMGKKEFHPIVKPAVLTAFLGYLAVILGLLFDLGLPWNIWHMIIYWQHHSALLEVGWCVMLYTTVLLLEFSPVPLEPFSRYAKIRAWLMKYRLVLVILGIMLSTLHQSSLGSLFLIMPYRLHALWYTPILPILFFISAVGLGLMMVTLESLITSYLYRRKPETQLLAKLGKAAVWVLGLYLVVRLGEIIYAGEFALIFNGQWESYLFIIEICLTAVIPMILLSIPRVRRSLPGLWTCAWMVVIGFVFNRINTSGVSMLRNIGDEYFPLWTEIVISVGVVSAAVLAFMFMVEKFNVWEVKPKDEEEALREPAHFDRSSEAWLGEPGYSGRIKYSLAFIIAAAIGFALMPSDRIYSEGREALPAQKARGTIDTLIIDGNRDLNSVAFKHNWHAEKIAEHGGCARCHHMNIPLDKNSGCFECHSLMYEPSDAFGHDWHSSPKGGNISCDECHTPGEHRTAETASACEECHKDLIPAEATIRVNQHHAPGYVDAMHGLCVECHKNMAEVVGKPQLSFCATCHGEHPMPHMGVDYEGYIEKEKGQNWLALPGKKE